MLSSPRFQFMMPLCRHQKNDVQEDEPSDLEVSDENKARITFNEELVVCTFQTHQPPSNIKKSVNHLAGTPRLSWINPTLNTTGGAVSPKSPSILKNFSPSFSMSQ